MKKSKPIFTSPFEVNATYPEFTSLNQIEQFASEASKVIWNAIGIPNISDDADRAREHIRAGFVGSIIINEAKLIQDDTVSDKSISLEGPLFQIDMSYHATGLQNPIEVIAGLAIGEGKQRIEIRAYDLNEKRFGTISCEALKQYLKSSQLKGGGTGTTRVKAVGISRRSSAQVRRNK